MKKQFKLGGSFGDGAYDLETLMCMVVTVFKKYERVDTEEEDGLGRQWIVKDLPKEEWRAGWIVGYRSLQCGAVVPGERVCYRDGDYDDTPTAFRCDLTVPAFMVCYWPTMKPIYSPPGGFEYGGQPKSPSQLHGEWWADYKKKHPMPKGFTGIGNF